MFALVVAGWCFLINCFDQSSVSQFPDLPGTLKAIEQLKGAQYIY